MMRKIFYIAILQVLTSVLLSAQGLSIKDIRKDFKVGHKDETTCKRHLQALEKYADSPVERGYEAAYHMFMAKHISNPFKKMSYFKSGKQMLEKEIAANPSNVELRYIRLCIQYYIPSYLGYKDNIEEDKDFLVNNLYKLNDRATKELLYTYLKGAKMYSEQELALLGR
ncbi:hypothetical protein [Sphingobacterium suaedae]|uniref:Uncharacterized protein n=1 Tax=Sphingobacterium suaedae TaxID=1686402 RepID=A0ABW5KF01_9SPHI